MGHFSKWLFIYPLKTKEGQEIIGKIKNFILCFNKPKIFQSDNEVNSKVMKSEYNLKIIILNLLTNLHLSQ